MREYDNGFTRVLSMQPLQRSDHPCLNFRHAFAVGKAECRRAELDLLPTLRLAQLFEWPTGPVAAIRFFDIFERLELQAQACGQRAGRFLAALERTAVDSYDLLGAKSLGECEGLLLTFFIQANPWRSTGESALFSRSH